MKEKILDKRIQSFADSFSFFFERLKVKIEIEKLKLDLKNKYKVLGRYVVSKKEKNAMDDFSHDVLYENKVNEIVWGFIREANRLYFNYKLDYFQAIQFARYRDGGHYDWHQDASELAEGQNEQRKLSLTLSLTDHTTYEGGLLQFYNGNRQYEDKDHDIERDIKSVGTAIVFDSRDWHRVTPVTKGTRYSLVCWTVGPNFI